MNRQIALQNINFCNEMVQLRNQIETDFLKLGAGLLKIRDGRMFEPNYESFREFCEGEMKMSESKASKLINIYRVFVLEYKLSLKKVAQVGWSNLSSVLPVIKDKSDAETWLDKAILLRQKDLAMEVKERQTGIEQKNCEHSNAYLISVCPDCGDRWRVYENEKPDK